MAPPPKDPPKVSQAYLTGKSSRPKNKLQASQPALPIAKIAAAVVALLLVGVGINGYQRARRHVGSLAEWENTQLPAATTAEEVATAVRTRILGFGGTPLPEGISVVIPEATTDVPEQRAQVEARFLMPVLGVDIDGKLSANPAGKHLIAGTYRGDGIPRSSVVGAAKLQKALSTAQCPEGTVLKGEPPPRGSETWCEKAGPKGKPIRHGPFFAFHPNGNALEEGTYKDGKRDGKWTRFNSDGLREAEAFYKDDVQQGRFRRWDAAGTQIMDVEYKDGSPVRR